MNKHQFLFWSLVLMLWVSIGSSTFAHAQTDDRDTTALLTAAANGDLTNLIDMVVKQGLDVNLVEPKNNNNALITATHHQRIGVIGWLITHNADRNHRNRFGSTALHVALSQKSPNPAVIKQLITQKNANLADNAGITPLMHASSLAYLETIKQLLSALRKGGANLADELNSPDSKGRCAIAYAVASGNVAAVKILREANALFHCGQLQPEDLMRLAIARSNSTQMIEYLLGSSSEIREHLAAKTPLAKKWFIELVRKRLYQSLPLFLPWEPQPPQQVFNLIAEQYRERPENFFEGSPVPLQLALDAIGPAIEEVKIKGLSLQTHVNKSEKEPLASVNSMVKIAVSLMKDKLSVNDLIELKEIRLVKTFNKTNTSIGIDNEQIISWLGRKIDAKLRYLYRNEAHGNLLKLYEKLSLMQCVVCLEDFEGKDVGPSGYCTCRYCDDCFVAQIKSQMESASQPDPAAEAKDIMVCLVCRSAIDATDERLLKRLTRAGFSQPEIENLQDLSFTLLSRKLSKHPQAATKFLSCHGKKDEDQVCTDGRVIIDDGDAYFNCPSCSWTGCLRCDKDHRGACEDAQKAEAAMKNLLQKGKSAAHAADPDAGAIRHCPWCKVKIFKDGGCNSFQCTQCGHSSNWNKGKKSRSHDSSTGAMAKDYDT